MSAGTDEQRTTKRREFTAHKIRLYDAMVRDAALSRMELAVSWVLLSTYLNLDTRTAWPSAGLVAKQLKVAERSVRRAMKSLIDAGWWTVQRGGGRGRSNCYEPAWHRAPKTVTVSSKNPDKPVRETLTNVTQNPDESVRGTPTKNPNREPPEGTRATSNPQSPGAEVETTKVARQEERDVKSAPRQRKLRVISDVLNQMGNPNCRHKAEQRLGNDIVQHFANFADLEDTLGGGFARVYRRAIDIEQNRPGYGLKYVIGAYTKAGHAT